jgi:hypothetical protein
MVGAADHRRPTSVLENFFTALLCDSSIDAIAVLLTNGRSSGAPLRQCLGRPPSRTGAAHGARRTHDRGWPSFRRRRAERRRPSGRRIMAPSDWTIRRGEEG